MQEAEEVVLKQVQNFPFRQANHADFFFVALKVTEKAKTIQAGFKLEQSCRDHSPASYHSIRQPFVASVLKPLQECDVRDERAVLGRLDVAALEKGVEQVGLELQTVLSQDFQELVSSHLNKTKHVFVAKTHSDSAVE